MAKWADFIISAVRYDSSGTHIKALKVHVDDGRAHMPRGSIWTFEDVAREILNGHTFITTVRDPNEEGEYAPGAFVHLTLRTHQDKSRKDNLTNLPQF
ncbi:DUF3892 domain-containing protein [Hyalangium rubrum]|uniref:DUF3892 domain-containing protein n=1 Tax=Hyalangium rubrum TaxID=3103134 RepID=UPI003BF49844